MSMAILFLLFMIQRFGTGRVGVVFSPIILLWFAALFGVGIYNIAVYDWRILRAIGPNAWLLFMIKNGHKGWLMLGGVVLCITGNISFVSIVLSVACHFVLASLKLFVIKDDRRAWLMLGSVVLCIAGNIAACKWLVV
jgi:K+ transporter